MRKDLRNIVQPHENALVVTLQIRGFDVKKVMIDQGSGAEIMYPNLYEGLGPTLENLMKYDNPLVAFDGKHYYASGASDPSRGVGGKKGDGLLYSGAFILPLHCNPWMSMDPFHGCSTLIIASEGEIPN